jgi:hypothetical protein
MYLHQPPRNLHLLWCFCMWLLINPNTPAAASTQCCVFMHEKTINEVRDKLKKNSADDNTKQAYKQLLKEADAALIGPDYSVTDKTLTPPSGDKRDYMSIGVYWWPDKSKPDGLPWVHRDGVINHATKDEQTDADRFAKFSYSVQTLALAGFMSGNEQYSTRAATLLRVWFLNNATRMKPNLRFAQSVPGRQKGRAEGILDGRFLATRIVDSVLLVQKTAAWTTADDKKMRQWMEDYVTWLTSNNAGKQEAKANNNHGTWYNVQVAGIARFLGQDALAKSLIEKTKKLVDKQIAANGTQPLELSRPRSFHYSYFNLQPLVLLAAMGTELGIDIWHYQNPKGASIEKALDYMAPYADPTKKWPHKNTERESLPMIPLLILADNALKRSKYQALVKAAQFDQVPPQDIQAKMGNVRIAQKDSWLMNLPHYK